jgi:hypothetical protein
MHFLMQAPCHSRAGKLILRRKTLTHHHLPHIMGGSGEGAGRPLVAFPANPFANLYKCGFLELRSDPLTTAAPA